MSAVVLLDSGPLGLVTNPRASTESAACNEWMAGLLARGLRIAIPEIADYEVRRELLRAGKIQGLARLDALKESIEYLPITTDVMLRAAQFWAQTRQQGRPTADNKAFDGDMILAAQASILDPSSGEPIIATTNVGHLEHFVAAKCWQDID